MTAASQRKVKNRDEDEELGPVPAHLRAQARSDGSAPPSADNYSSLARWVFPSKRPFHPRSQIACMLRAGARQHGTTESLKAINYGPVELCLRKLLAKLNWWRWWRRRRPGG